MEELYEKKIALEDRIKRLEADLKAPLAATNSEQASEISHHIVLRRLLEIERKNLLKVNFELEKLKQN